MRRTLQGVFLVAWLVVFLWLARPGSSGWRLDVGRTLRRVPVRLLCLIDPLASLGAFLADRALAVFVVVPLLVVALCLVFPRVFCSHVCPLGTVIDLVGKLRRKQTGAWSVKLKFIKYALLTASALFVVLGLGLVGLVTPLPILARGLRAGLSLSAGRISFDVFWLGLLVVILLLSLVRRRLWCNCLCPTGALLSLVSRFAVRKRVRSDACVSCGLCPTVCDFDAIREDDFGTTTDCTYCGECARVCKPGAIRYDWSRKPLPVSTTRREFLTGTVLTAGIMAVGTPLVLRTSPPRLRPPGALPGDDFLARCIRCGLCAHVCPGPAVSTVGVDGGLTLYGTPEIVPERAGCSPNCNNCGRTCPTGAIAQLTLEEKNRVVIGTAHHLTELCLPWQRRDPCGLCVDVCGQAGHNAIDWVRRPGSTDKQDLVPKVNAERCVGCGLCVMVCMQSNVTARRLLHEPAVAVTPKLIQGRLLR